MKRMLLLPAALLLLCAACTIAPTNTSNTTNSANTNAANINSTAATTAASWTDDDVINNERQVWDTIKRKDFAAFAAALADEFIDVTPVGIKNKAQTVDYVKTFDLTDVTLSDFKTVKLGKSAAAVTYTVRLKGSIGGKPIPENESAARASSAQVWRGGKWHAVYHQSSLVESAPAPPATAAASPAATTAASPAATAVQATDNIMANEEAVWDALRRKDWDGFAGFLAEDQIEVDATGVRDKAGTLSGVRQGDFSSVKISELRVMGVGAGDEAKVVTYRVTGTAPDKTPINEYAASIWALRGGQWRAVFHQGTPVRDTGP